MLITNMLIYSLPVINI